MFRCYTLISFFANCYTTKHNKTFFLITILGSEGKPEERPNKTKDLKDPKQIGFGENEEQFSENIRNEKKIDSDIFSAMKKAQPIKAGQFSFNPKDEQKGKGIKKIKKERKLKFTYV